MRHSKLPTCYRMTSSRMPLKFFVPLWVTASEKLVRGLSGCENPRRDSELKRTPPRQQVRCYLTHNDLLSVEDYH